MEHASTLHNLLTPARKLYRSADGLVRLGWYDSWTAEGDAGNGLQTVAYAGTRAFKNYFFRKIFSRAFFEHSWGRIPYWQLETRLSKTRRRPALVVHEVSAARAKFFNLPSDFRIPVWISVLYDLSGETGDPALAPQFADARRRIRKQGLEAEYETPAKKQPRAEIVRIVKNGSCIASGFLDYSEDVPQISAMGTNDGSERWMRLGALDAVYYFSLIRAREKGHASANLGYSHGFADDGTLRYKLGLGGRLAPKFLPDAGYWNVKMNGAAGKRLLANHPFICLEESRFLLTGFAEATGSAALLSKLQKITAPDFDVRILPLKSFEPSVSVN